MTRSSFASYTFDEKYISVSKFDRELRTGVAYVENERDICFWREVFNKSKKMIYDVRPWGISDGKRNIESMADKANVRAVIAMDADYDYLCQNYREKSKITSNKYAMHTYSHSRESVICGDLNIIKIINKIKRVTPPKINAIEIIREYSKICYSTLPSFLFLLNKSREMPEGERINESILKRTLYIEKIKGIDIVDGKGEFNHEFFTQVRAKSEELNSFLMSKITGKFDDEFETFKKSLNELGVNEDTAYRYINGHSLYNGLIDPLFKAVIKSIKNEEKIKLRELFINEGIEKPEENEHYNTKLSEIDNAFKRNCCCHNTLLLTTEPPMNDAVYKKIIQKLLDMHLP